MTKRFKNLALTGILSKAEVAELPGTPGEERLNKGPVAVIECADLFPCNPCESACPEEAITIGEDITNLPVLDEEKCNGCGLCIPACPGLAISVVDLAYSDDEAVVRIPYEFLPLPEKEDKVTCLSREGKVIADGRILRVVNPKSHDRTPVLWVAVPKTFAMDVRAIRLSD